MVPPLIHIHEDQRAAADSSPGAGAVKQRERERERGNWNEENWILQIMAENKQERIYNRRGLQLQRTSDNNPKMAYVQVLFLDL